MARLATLFLVCLLAVAEPARAIQLHWADGSTNLNITQSTEAMLLVQADSAEVTLPGQWTLQWTADSLGVQFSALDANQACLVDTAKVDSIAQPSTPADSATHQIIAYFCSSGGNNASTAYFLADLPGGGHGKMKVVALNPADTTLVIESNEVTFNGGIEGDYAPLVLRATSIHQSLRLQVTAVGVNLNAVNLLKIAAVDQSWNLPLTITARGDSAITGVASVAALLPACEASVGSAGGVASAAPLPADQGIQLDIPESGGCTAQYFEELVQPPPPGLGYAIQPKDFSFTPDSSTPQLIGMRCICSTPDRAITACRRTPTRGTSATHGRATSCLGMDPPREISLTRPR